MSKFIGATVDVGIAKESVRGTAESAATFWLPKINLSIDDMIEQAHDENSLGVIEDIQGSNLVYKYAEGELEAKVGDKSIGLILLATLGSVSTSGPTDSAYTHTFSVLQSAQHPSLTLFTDDGNQDYKHALGMITSFELSATTGSIINYKAGFRAKVGATATLSPSYSAENLFLAQHITFKTASTQAGLDAASAIVIRSVDFKIEKNVEDDKNLGTTEPTDILNKQFAIEGSLELVFDANTMKTEMLADTVKAMRIQLDNTDVLIGSTSTPRIQFDFHAVKFSEFTRNYGNGDIVTASVSFKAFYKLADAKMVTVALRNAVASY